MNKEVGTVHEQRSRDSSWTKK